MAKIAGAQHGVLTRQQLLEVGVGSAGIGRRLANGVLHTEFRGVYRLGHRAPSALARYAAAVLACGEGAALCGRPAAWVLGLLRGEPPAPEVIVAAHRHVTGVTVHRARNLPADHTRIWHGIRVTTVPRLLVDLAPTTPISALAEIHHHAHVRFATPPSAIEAVLATRPTTKNAQTLRAIIHGDAPVLLSRLERGFRTFLKDNHLPMPSFNRPANGHYVDCRWPHHHLTVELDSFRFHNDRATWEKDRQRDRGAHDRGDDLRRFTWRDVFEDQRHMLRQLNRLLPASAARPGRSGTPAPSRAL